MLRVGIEFSFKDEGWLGGINALAHLLKALKGYSSSRIEAILIANPKSSPELFAALPEMQVLRTSFVDPTSSFHLARRFCRQVIGRDIFMEQWLALNNIDVFSHCESLGRFSTVPTIGQIHDFGYRYFRDYYEESVWRRKDAGTYRICKEHHVIIMSSQSILDDYKKFFPDALAKGVVLNPVPSENPGRAVADSKAFRRERGLPDRYFYAPNQFWAHKNHEVIIDALGILIARGEDIHVISTGATTDARRPEHFANLMRRAEEKGVTNRFHVLGVIPFADTVGLMSDCMAVVQPSLFEGWGMSVAEARMMGKPVILSDIPVFREQAPEYGVFFDPHRPSELADAMARVARQWSPEVDSTRRVIAEQKRSAALDAYARGYEEIVFEAVRRGRNK